MSGTVKVRKYLHTAKRFGEVISEQRLSLCITVEQLAQTTNTPVALIRDAEAGCLHLDLSQAECILDTLGIQPVVLPAELATH